MKNRVPVASLSQSKGHAHLLQLREACCTLGTMEDFTMARIMTESAVIDEPGISNDRYKNGYRLSQL